MSTTPQTAEQTNLNLDDAERAELAAIVEQSLADLRVEHRRTDSFGYREKLEHRLELLNSILAKLQSGRPA